MLTLIEVGLRWSGEGVNYQTSKLMSSLYDVEHTVIYPIYFQFLLNLPKVFLGEFSEKHQRVTPRYNIVIYKKQTTTKLSEKKALV